MTRAIVSSVLLGLLIASFAGGCSVDPQRTCENSCEEQRRRMCNGFSGDENCVTNCASAEANYDSAAADADRIGCSSQFNSAYGCFSGGDYCDNSRCNAENNVLVSCITSYCLANPTDRICPTP